MEPEESFGKVLRAARKQRRLTQEKLAGAAGLERNYISSLEGGNNSPTIRALFKLCAILGVPPSELIAHIEERIQSNYEQQRVKGHAP
jgi:transcriptional regulator with XRE-family HTH domain